MREVSPVEKALQAVRKFRRELRLLESELVAYMPTQEVEPRVDYLVDPVTGKKRKIKRVQGGRHGV
jgi:hypothetical protein